jgi:hypothetical protein
MSFQFSEIQFLVGEALGDYSVINAERLTKI